MCVFLEELNLNSLFSFMMSDFRKFSSKGISLFESVVQNIFIFNFLKQIVFYCFRLRMYNALATFILVAMVSNTLEIVQERSGIFLTMQRCFSPTCLCPRNVPV